MDSSDALPPSSDSVAASLAAADVGEDPFSAMPPQAEPARNSESGSSNGELSPDVKAIAEEMAKVAILGKEAEPVIRQAVVTGNFNGAVECCIQAGLMAEALLLAQCGDQALWLKTQATFFDMQKKRYPFLGMLHAIIGSELGSYVTSSDLHKWKETLAVIATYCKSEDFQG